MTRTTPPPTWGRAFNRALRHQPRPTTTMHYRAADYLALCGIHRPEDMLTDDRAAVTCAEVMGLTLQSACRLRAAAPLPANAKWLRSHPNYRRG